MIKLYRSKVLICPFILEIIFVVSRKKMSIYSFFELVKKQEMIDLGNFLAAQLRLETIHSQQH